MLVQKGVWNDKLLRGLNIAQDHLVLFCNTVTFHKVFLWPHKNSNRHGFCFFWEVQFLGPTLPLFYKYRSNFPWNICWRKCPFFRFDSWCLCWKLTTYQWMNWFLFVMLNSLSLPVKVRTTLGWTSIAVWYIFTSGRVIPPGLVWFSIATGGRVLLLHLNFNHCFFCLFLDRMLLVFGKDYIKPVDHFGQYEHFNIYPSNLWA